MRRPNVRTHSTPPSPRQPEFIVHAPSRETLTRHLQQLDRDCAQGGDSIAVGAVVDVHSATVGCDDPGPGSLGEVVADGRFGRPENGGEFTAVLLPGS